MAWVCPLKSLTFATCIGMPVIFEKQIDTAKKLAVWHITESETELFEINHYLPDVKFTSKRNIELVVSRILLNYLIGADAHLNLTKDKFGKPYLNNSEIAVSFSHSQQMVACFIAMDGVSVGIDIEKKRERISLMAEKFCTNRDQSGHEGILHYHLVWGGKEVLYKIYAKRELDFKKNLQIDLKTSEGVGHIMKDGKQTSHNLGYEFLSDYILVWGF